MLFRSPSPKAKNLSLQRELFSISRDSEILDLGLHQPELTFHEPNFLTQTDEESDGPPPGFPFKLFSHNLPQGSLAGSEKQKGKVLLDHTFEKEDTILTTPQPSVRRSRRIEEKNTGAYKSAIEKAQLTQGYSANTGQAFTPRNKSKNNKPVKLTYLESHGPLSPSQAEVVVSIAGVELGQELADKIRKFIPDQVSSIKESA